MATPITSGYQSNQHPKHLASMRGFILVSILVLIVMMSTIVITLMHHTQVQQTLQSHLIQRWQIQKALQWATADIAYQLPPKIANQCHNHLCSQATLIMIPHWHTVRLPSAFIKLHASYIANRFSSNGQTITEILIKIGSGEINHFQMLTRSCSLSARHAQPLHLLAQDATDV